MSAVMHTPGPLFVEQPENWPFNILIVDGAGNEIFFERRHAYGTTQSTVAEVMAGSCFSNPETRAAAIESNGRQLADAYLRAAAPELLEALKVTAQALAWLAHGECRGFHSGLASSDDALTQARAAIAKAEGGAQ